MYGLRSLELSTLLKAKEYDMKLCYEWKHKGMLFTHGRYTNKYSAFKELDVNGISGISGHVHRHMVFSKSDKSGRKVWISAPCMQDIRKQDFYHGDNWQTGYVVLTFNTQSLVDYKVINT